jgi:hypothetical protein
MKENRISVEIDRPIRDVFRFTTNPSNTPKWIDGIQKEETSEWPVKVSSIYRNVDAKGKWTVYVLTKLENNQMFEMLSEDKNYHVRYTYTPISETKSQLEYYEWVDKGDLKNPFTQEVLNNLKRVMEANN